MAYLVIARKYRPLNFEDVIGQEHVTRTLMNAIKLDKVHHAFIFTGPRGVGKTTVSRILAKALNCEKGVTAQPCGVCKNCVEIDKGFSLDVKEIDGASNRGIDEIRDLRDDIKFSPASCRKKIYIIDEVHMLTTQAFNALLKTLEEPPEHAIFIFATTEINEVPATILSRCQRYDFKRIQVEVLTRALQEICDREKVSIDKESLQLIARAGDGSVRDSESVLDQIIAYCGSDITAAGAAEALGMPTLDLHYEFLDIVIRKDSNQLLKFIDKLVYDGIHIISFVKGLIEFFRNLLVLKSTADGSLVYLTEENIAKLKGYTGSFREEDLLYFMDLISQGVGILKLSSFQRIDFEIILLKILHYDSYSKVDDLLKRMSLIEGEGEIDLNSFIDEIGGQLPVPSVSPAVVEEEVPPVKTEVEPLPQSKQPEAVADNPPEKGSVVDGGGSAGVNPAEAEEIYYYSEEENFDHIPQPEEVVSVAGNETIALIETEQTAALADDEKQTVIIEDKQPAAVQTSEIIEAKQPLVPEVDISEKPTASEHQLSFELIKKSWLQLGKEIMKAIPQIGKLWEYGVPVSLLDGNLLVKFAAGHKTYRNLCKTKSVELGAVFRSFFDVAQFAVNFTEGSVADEERLIVIKEKKRLSPEELKNELLKEAPQLEFLFDQPLNCKVIK